jgi:hypothetical protein
MEQNRTLAALKHIISLIKQMYPMIFICSSPKLFNKNVLSSSLDLLHVTGG